MGVRGGGKGAGARRGCASVKPAMARGGAGERADTCWWHARLGTRQAIQSARAKRGACAAAANVGAPSASQARQTAGCRAGTARALTRSMSAEEARASTSASWSSSSAAAMMPSSSARSLGVCARARGKERSVRFSGAPAAPEPAKRTGGPLKTGRVGRQVSGKGAVSERTSSCLGREGSRALAMSDLAPRPSRVGARDVAVGSALWLTRERWRRGVDCRLDC